MTNQDLRNEWAWGRIEAMADGSLSPSETQRMREAMNLDAGLQLAVKRAKTVRRQLRSMALPRPSRGLLRALLGKPRRQSVSWSGFAAPVGAFSVAVIAALLVVPMRQPAEDPGVAALRDFAIAMSYLQRSAERTSDEVRDQVGAGLYEAFTMSRDSLSEVAASKN